MDSGVSFSITGGIVKQIQVIYDDVNNHPGHKHSRGSHFSPKSYNYFQVYSQYQQVSGHQPTTHTNKQTTEDALIQSDNIQCSVATNIFREYHFVLT